MSQEARDRRGLTGVHVAVDRDVHAILVQQGLDHDAHVLHLLPVADVGVVHGRVRHEHHPAGECMGRCR